MMSGKLERLLIILLLKSILSHYKIYIGAIKPPHFVKNTPEIQKCIYISTFKKVRFDGLTLSDYVSIVIDHMQQGYA